MGRHVAPLVLADLPELVSGCGSCVLWQLGPVRCREHEGNDAAKKRAWVAEVSETWGSCGLVLRIDARTAGHVLYAPAAMVPRAGVFATSPVSPDAVVLVGLGVDEQYAGHGLAKVLVQAMARDLLKRGGSVRAVEAFGDTRGEDGQSCLLPADFLQSVGFRIHRAHSRTPRLRLDLATTVRWRVGLSDALARLRVLPAAPAPAPGASTFGPSSSSRALPRRAAGDAIGADDPVTAG